MDLYRAHSPKHPPGVRAASAALFVVSAGLSENEACLCTRCISKCRGILDLPLVEVAARLDVSVMV